MGGRVAGAPGFQGPLRAEHLAAELWQLLEPLEYLSEGCDRYPELRGRRITVPAGLVYDGASIPRPVWAFMPSKSATAEEGALHDWIWRVGPQLSPPIGYAAGNWLLWESLTLSREGWAWQRWCMWAGVAVGGWASWARWRELAARRSEEGLLLPLDQVAGALE